MRKVIEFDDATYQALVQLGRDRMATLQELADEAFDDVLKKHGVPRDLKDALRKSAKAAEPKQVKSRQAKKAARTRK
jgi:non-homologous end joining protein Ku